MGTGVDERRIVALRGEDLCGPLARRLALYLIAARLLFIPCFCCQFDEKLGNGAYKDVYLAYDTETGKEVAWSDAGTTREKMDGGRASVHAAQHA